MRERINALVKKREGFRPFAPAVLAESVSEYFSVDQRDAATYAHMLYVVPVKPEYREALPSITHEDGSARVQTVSQDDHPTFWKLIDLVGERTGFPVVLNTSFNVRGQPIVCNPDEALETFLWADLHALAIGNYVVTPIGE